MEHRPEGARDARSHRVRLQPNSRGAEALGSLSVKVNSSHHQAIKELAPGLLPTGWTDDDLVEVVETPLDAPWLLAVQWHPEEMHAEARAPEHGLFAALVHAANSGPGGLVGEGGKEEPITHAIQRTS